MILIIQNIGINRLIDVFKGHKSFGCVKLKNNYRSSLSELAEIKTANDTKLAKGLSVSIRGVNSDERNELDRFVSDGYQWDIERIYESLLNLNII